MNESNRLRYAATADDEGERADVVLGRSLAGLSRRVARAMALEGRLRIDGKRAKPSAKVRAGMVLELDAPTEGEPPPLEVIARDPHFVFVRKPAGVHTHGLRPGEHATLSHAVALEFPECATASPDPREGGAVHRLDRETSGVVAFARSPEAYARARAAFAEGTVSKRYRAVCVGAWPPSAPAEALPGWLVRDEHDGALALTIRAPIGRGPTSRTAGVRLDGQRATTTVSRLDEGGGRVLVELALVTGRRHQARVHLAYVGLPIAGDPLYGETPASRLYLHAVSLDLQAAGADQPAQCLPEPDFWPKRTGPNNPGPS